MTDKEAEKIKSTTCALPVNTYFENARRRFLFTVSNRTSYMFVLDGSSKECGILDAPLREVGVGTKEEPTEFCIRGYKRSYALYGVTYTVRFRILDATEKDTNYRLHVFLAVGDNATNNYFGWFICDGEERILSPLEWKDGLNPRDGYNRPKRDFRDHVLNHGGMYHLRASFAKLGLEIEMLTDNQSHSTPTMIIRGRTSTAH